MNDKELHARKYQAQLDEWKADIDKLKAKAKGASADAELEMNKLIDGLDSSVTAANAKLAELKEAGEDAWDDVKKSVESTWDSLKTSMHDVVAALKK